MRRLAPDVPEQQLASGREPEAEQKPQSQLDQSILLLPVALFVLVMAEGFMLAISVR